MSDALFVTPLPETSTRAVAIAREAWEGEIGDTAEIAYREQMDRSLAQTGMTMDELDRLGAPRTWVGRLLERVQDWWWDYKAQGDDHNDLEAAFAFPVPLLQTKALQDTPFEYDEVDRLMVAAAEEIARAITSQTDWARVAFKRPMQTEEELDDDLLFPVEQIVALWNGPDQRCLVLIEGLDEDPKLMGRSFGLLHLDSGRAAALFG